MQSVIRDVDVTSVKTLSFDSARKSVISILNVSTANPPQSPAFKGNIAYDIISDQIWFANGSVWAQIGGSPTGPAGGDLTGTYPNPTIAPGVITAAQIALGTITAAQIANNTITSANILDGTITGADIANGTITSANILDGTITGADIANGTITAANLAPGVLISPFTQIGSVTNGVINGDVTITPPNDTSIQTASDFYIVYVGPNMPTPTGSYVNNLFNIGIQAEFIVTGAIVAPVVMTIDIPSCPYDLTTSGIGAQVAFVAGLTSNANVSWMTLDITGPQQVTLNFYIPNIAQTYRSSVINLYAGAA